MEKLGQNFLINKAITQRIVQSANLTPLDFVLEIGPGKGILTEELAKHASKVVAVEIDKELSNLLSNKFGNKKNIKIIEGDILKINARALLRSSTPKYKIVANLPYYITSPIIRIFLESEFPPNEMILMVQKEVAERIVEKPGKMSILSVAVQYYARPEILFYVSKENFEPIPEVDSAVIRITCNMEHETSGRDFNRKFFRVVRAGFCAKRKTLVNNLANSFHLNKKEVEEKIRKSRLSLKVRAQELSIEDWKKLALIF
jgi:16S rRNA (adenine1518-N6/adenine1519-N6)-dimethyltransferase